MGYGRGKTEGGHKRGHSGLAYWGTHQEAKEEARKRRRLAEREVERNVARKAGASGPATDVTDERGDDAARQAPAGKKRPRRGTEP